MKQLFKPLSILLLVIISALWTSASAVEIDGIYYYLHDNEATVTNKSQRSYAYGDSNYINAYSGNITYALSIDPSTRSVGMSPANSTATPGTGTRPVIDIQKTKIKLVPYSN